MEFLSEIGCGRVVIRTDTEPAARALATAVAASLEDETLIEEILGLSPASLGALEHDHSYVGGIARTLRVDMERRLGERLPIQHAGYAWLLRHGAWR